MTTLSIFKGHKNTLSYYPSDTHHRELKNSISQSQEAIRDLKALIVLTKGNNIDNHFHAIRKNPKNTIISFFDSQKKKPFRCLSDTQKSRFIVQKTNENKLIESISSKFKEKLRFLDRQEDKNEMTIMNRKVNSYRETLKSSQKQMSSANFSKYMSFLNSEEHIFNENPNKKNISVVRTSPRNRRNSLNVKNNENLNGLTIKPEELTNFPRVRTIRKSILSENVIMEKMFVIARKVMKNIQKLEHLNNYNKIKTCNELIKLFNNNPFLNSLFFNSNGKEMNPKLSENFIAHSVIIYPPKFTRNPLENRIKYNYEGIKVLETLSEKIKEFCFNKKLLELQSEQKDILDLQKALKKIEGKYIHKPNSRFLKKVQTFKTTLEAPPAFNSQISKIIKEFEERYGKLEKVKEKSKIVGEKVDNMMQDLYDNFASFDHKF